MDFVEEIVLKEMFRLHAHGPTIERHLIEICHFDEIAIRNAIAICKDKGLIHDTDSGNIRLTSNGISEYKKKLGQKQMKNKTVESESTDQQMEESMSSIKIFISHSEKDMKIAQLLLNVLENSFVIPENAIRCTSVPGYKLPTGAHTSSTLKKELSKTELVVGILTSHSLRSEYVFFELGAGWGMEKWTVALLGSDVDFKNIPGPLKEHYAISLINNSSLFQLIEEISEKLDYEIRSLSKSSSSIEKLVDFVKSSAIDENIVDKEVDKQLEILQKFKLKYETFLRGFEAEWVAVRDSEPDNISDGKYLIDGAFTDIIEFSSQIVLDVETGLKEIFDEAAKRLKKLEKQKLKIDGGRSYAKFWKEGNEIIELLKEIPIAIDEHIRMLNP